MNPNLPLIFPNLNSKTFLKITKFMLVRSKELGMFISDVINIIPLNIQAQERDC